MIKFVVGRNVTEIRAITNQTMYAFNVLASMFLLSELRIVDLHCKYLLFFVNIYLFSATFVAAKITFSMLIHSALFLFPTHQILILFKKPFFWIMFLRTFYVIHEYDTSGSWFLFSKEKGYLFRKIILFCIYVYMRNQLLFKFCYHMYILF